MKQRAAFMTTAGSRAAGWGAGALACIAALRLADGAPYAAGFLAASFGLTVFALARTRRPVGLSAVLDSANPARLLPLLDAPPGWLVDDRGRQALATREAALALALLGRFDDARALLSRVDWSAQEPLVSGAGLVADALLDLLDTHEFGRARNLLNRAVRSTTSSDEKMPHPAITDLFAMKNAADLLAGDMVEVSLEQLALAARSEQLLARLIAHWALGTHMWWEEERERAEQHFAACVELAPHCAVLHCAPPVRK